MGRNVFETLDVEAEGQVVMSNHDHVHKTISELFEEDGQGLLHDNP